MASTSYLYFTLLLTLFLFFPSHSTAFPIPRRHGVAIMKDFTKGQYFSSIVVGDPPSTFTFVLDLGSLYSWQACDATYISKTFRRIPCGSAKCAAYGGRGCTNNTCAVFAYSPWNNTIYSAGLIEDTIFFDTLLKKPAKVVQYPMNGFPFACTGTGPLEGITDSAKGVLSLANVNNAFHSVVSKAFGVPHKFALCLPNTDTIRIKNLQGALYIGGGPYYMSKGDHRDFSKSLVTTPLVINPKSSAPVSNDGETSVEYFINVKAIEVGGTSLNIDPSLLSINKNGVGGTKLSTVNFYTVLHSSVYKALVDVFTAKANAMGITRVGLVGKFGACYDSRFMANTTSGPGVPTVDFVLDGKNNARWRMYGANLMVKFSDVKLSNVRCLGFIDGGLNVTTSIVIGGKQMEDNIVEIDLETSKVGFSSAPVKMGLSCSQFQSTLPTF